MEDPQTIWRVSFPFSSFSKIGLHLHDTHMADIACRWRPKTHRTTSSYEATTVDVPLPDLNSKPPDYQISTLKPPVDVQPQDYTRQFFFNDCQSTANNQHDTREDSINTTRHGNTHKTLLFKLLRHSTTAYPFGTERMGTAGRPKGAKNKGFHKAGGDRRSTSFKELKQESKQEKQKKADDFFMARSAANRQPRSEAMPVSHPQSEANLLAARNLLWAELQHPSMPQGRNLPSFCAADATDETVWNDKEQYDDGIDYDDDNEDNNEDGASKKFRQSYMPPEGTPLYTKLASIQKEMTKGPMKKRWSFPESSPMSAGLGDRPAPNAFYKNVQVRNWNVKAQYPGLKIEYCCISCGDKNLKSLGTRYRPAFGWSTIEWVIYERFSCQNSTCKGGKKNKTKHCCFSTIDPHFIAQLPTVVARDFEYVFPASGPGVLLEMATMFLHFTDQHILFSAFANAVNSMHREQYYKVMNQYYHLLNQWLDAWPRLDIYKGVPPLHANNYKGTPMVPYSAFGRTGYHNGIVMTQKLAKAIFFM